MDAQARLQRRAACGDAVQRIGLRVAALARNGPRAASAVGLHPAVDKAAQRRAVVAQHAPQAVPLCKQQALRIAQLVVEKVRAQRARLIHQCIEAILAAGRVQVAAHGHDVRMRSRRHDLAAVAIQQRRAVVHAHAQRRLGAGRKQHQQRKRHGQESSHAEIPHLHTIDMAIVAHTKVKSWIYLKKTIDKPELSCYNFDSSVGLIPPLR